PRCSAWPGAPSACPARNRPRSARSCGCLVRRARRARSAGGGNRQAHSRVKGAAGRSVPVALFLGRAITLRRELPKMNADVQKSNRKAELLATTVEHVAIDQYDARPVIDAMRQMSFTSRDTARAADIWPMSLEDAGC